MDGCPSREHRAPGPGGSGTGGDVAPFARPPPCGPGSAGAWCAISPAWRMRCRP